MLPVESFTTGVGQPLIILASVARLVCRIRPVFLFRHLAPWRSKSGEISPALPPDVGLGHPIQSFTDMGRADAVCAQYCRPAGVAFRFQVCRYSIEPTFSNRACNLLPKDNVRAALADKVEEHGPQVALVGLAELLACVAEGLAGTGAGPNRSSCGPVGKLQGVTPSADSGEEVALGIFGEFMRFNFGDAAFVHVSGWYQPGADEFAEPCGGFRVVFVVVVHVVGGEETVDFFLVAALRAMRSARLMNHGCAQWMGTGHASGITGAVAGGGLGRYFRLGRRLGTGTVMSSPSAATSARCSPKSP